MKWYVSFGQTHKHIFESQHRDTLTSIVLDKDCLFEIEADSYNEAYKKAEKLFGNEWASLYGEEEALNKSIFEWFPAGIYRDES